jgi:hypothetical protein
MDVASLLRDLGLEQYVETFAENDVDGDVLVELTEEDLATLGVSLGHRKKILRAIRHEKRIDVTFSEALIITIPFFVLGFGSWFFWKYGYAGIEVSKDSYFDWHFSSTDEFVEHSEASGRYKFLSTQFLLFFVQITAIVVFCYEMIKLLSVRSIQIIFFCLVMTGGLIILSITLIKWPFGWTSHYMGEAFINASMNSIWFLACQDGGSVHCSSKYLGNLVYVSNRIFMLTAVAIVIGTISCLGRYRCGKQMFLTDALLSQQMKRLQRYIYLGSVLFVVGLLHTYLLYRWSSFAITDKSNFLPIYNDLLNNLALYFGIYYSAALASVYIPVISILIARIDQFAVISILHTNNQATPENIDSWKNANGLTFTTADYMKSTFAILAPFIAGALGSVGEAFSSIGSAIPQ